MFAYKRHIQKSVYSCKINDNYLSFIVKQQVEEALPNKRRAPRRVLFIIRFSLKEQAVKQ